jgi:hypothetical protein
LSPYRPPRLTPERQAAIDHAPRVAEEISDGRVLRLIIGIIPIALNLPWRDEDVLPVFPAPRVDIAVDVLDFGRVAIRIIAAAARGIIRHVPRRIKLLVQSFILLGMTVLRRCGGDYQDESRREICPSHAAFLFVETAIAWLGLTSAMGIDFRPPAWRVFQTQPRGLHVRAGIAYPPERFGGVSAILLIAASISYGG